MAIRCEFINMRYEIVIYGTTWEDRTGAMKISEEFTLPQYDEAKLLEFIRKNDGDFQRVIGARVRQIAQYTNHAWSDVGVIYVNVDGELTKEDQEELEELTYQMS